MNKVNLKKECRDLLQDLGSILPKFSHIIENLPIKRDKIGNIIYSEDYLILQDIRNDISNLKWKFQNFIDQKNKNGW